MESTSRSLPPLWTDLAALLASFRAVQNRLDPARLNEFAAGLAPLAQALSASLQSLESELRANPNPSRAESALARASSQLLQASARFAEAGAEPAQHGIMKAYLALRPVARAEEILFEVAGEHEDISALFLVPERAAPAAERIASAHARADSQTPPRGRIDVENARGKRGGYTLYVPECYTPDHAWPLVIALHGGSGHGADFFWSWLAEARTSGLILAAPTSRDRTWSLHSPAVDAGGLNRMLAQISSDYNVDTQRILLTGISDGGTYAMLLSTAAQAPFTHYAPVAAAVHALVSRDGKIHAPLRGVRVYQVHGARDWMFPVDRARAAAEALKTAGAEIVYREISDLSHNYPRDANAGIVDWFLGKAEN